MKPFSPSLGRRAALGLSAGALSASLCRPAVAQRGTAGLLRFIPQADVTILDPLTTTAYPTRNHGHLCWDTLYGVDENFVPQPQLAEGHVVEDDGRRWVFTLRDGLVFHDGERIRAADAVASIKRWMPRDTHGQTLAARLDGFRVLDDRRFEVRLSRPFPLLLDGLAKVSSYPCFVFPERFAATDASKAITEVVGSGPYRFVADERVVGSRVAYRRFDRYVPTPVGRPSMIAGPKIAGFERMEWRVVPDASTAAAAMQAGEADWWEIVPGDLEAVLARSPAVRFDRLDKGGIYASLRFNQLHPPFNDPAARRALLQAVDQSDFMLSTNGDDPKAWRDGVGFFPVNSPYSSDVALEPLTGKRDPAAAKAALAAAGKAGASVSALHATDVAQQNALMSVGVDTMRKAGFTVDDAVIDWGTLLQRRANRNPPGQGGWNALISLFGGNDLVSPASNFLLRGNGGDAWFGWPDAPKLEALREAWIDAPDEAGRKALARDIQRQAMIDLPFIPLGQFFPGTAYRKDLTDIRPGVVLPLNVRRA